MQVKLKDKGKKKNRKKVFGMAETAKAAEHFQKTQFSIFRVELQWLEHRWNHEN